MADADLDKGSTGSKMTDKKSNAKSSEEKSTSPNKQNKFQKILSEVHPVSSSSSARANEAKSSMEATTDHASSNGHVKKVHVKKSKKQ